MGSIIIRIKFPAPQFVFKFWTRFWKATTGRRKNKGEKVDVIVEKRDWENRKGKRKGRERRHFRPNDL